MKTVEIKGEKFQVKSNGDNRDSCYGCHFHQVTRWNKRGPGNCTGTTRILDVCSDNNLGDVVKNKIMIKL